MHKLRQRAPTKPTYMPKMRVTQVALRRHIVYTLVVVKQVNRKTNTFKMQIHWHCWIVLFSVPLFSDRKTTRKKSYYTQRAINLKESFRFQRARILHSIVAIRFKSNA